jgi:Rrf2 family protein
MLTKSTEYAIRALLYVQIQNWKEKRPGVPEIAREIEAPVAYTAKILHTLTSRHFLASMKGRGGGFFYEQDQPDHSLYDIIVLLEGEALFTNCGIGLKNCSDENPCPLHHDFVKVRNALYGIFTTETIRSLAEKIRSGNAVLNRNIINSTTHE